MSELKLLDTIGQTCIVKMPKGLFAKLEKISTHLEIRENIEENISEEKRVILEKARKDAYSSKGYNSVEDFFNDLTK